MCGSSSPLTVCSTESDSSSHQKVYYDALTGDSNVQVFKYIMSPSVASVMAT